MIINLDWEANRITLSAKAFFPIRGTASGRKYTEGSLLKGKGTNLTNFGAFVSAGRRGGRAFAYFQTGARQKIKHAGDVMKTGEELEVKIEKSTARTEKFLFDLTGSDKDTSAASGNEDDFRGYIGKSPKTMGTLGDLIKKKNKFWVEKENTYKSTFL